MNNKVNKKLDKFLNKESRRKLMLEMAEKTEELEGGLYKEIKLNIPVMVKLYWDKETHSCELKWWSEDCMKDAIEYHIKDLVENETKDLKNEIDIEIKKVIEFCEAENIPLNELFNDEEYVNKIFYLYEKIFKE